MLEGVDRFSCYLELFFNKNKKNCIIVDLVNFLLNSDQHVVLNRIEVVRTLVSWQNNNREENHQDR